MLFNVETKSRGSRYTFLIILLPLSEGHLENYSTQVPVKINNRNLISMATGNHTEPARPDNRRYASKKS